MRQVTKVVFSKMAFYFFRVFCFNFFIARFTAINQGIVISITARKDVHQRIAPASTNSGWLGQQKGSFVLIALSLMVIAWATDGTSPRMMNPISGIRMT